MKDINVVHLSTTPLVGAPGKVSKYLSLEGCNSIHFFIKDYPEPLKNFFNSNSCLLNLKNVNINKFFSDAIRSADIIHIHNNIPIDLCYKILETNNRCKYVYQVHSPLREPPLFSNFESNLPFKFDAKLCVAHIHPRLYDDYIMVPNLIDHPGVLRKRDESKIRIIFSPSHNRCQKEYIFSTKLSPNIQGNLEFLERKYSSEIEVINMETKIEPQVLLKIREGCDITVDEIVTGGFHQVSCEGLSCGNIVLNNADFFAKKSFSDAIRADALPPFLRVNDQNFLEIVLNLTKDRSLLNKYRQSSYDFYHKFMLPQRLIHCFTRIYEEIL